ncbi:MAG: hypothetical protein ACJ8BC_16180 [Gemmatimonadales bacterium]
MTTTIAAQNHSTMRGPARPPGSATTGTLAFVCAWPGPGERGIRRPEPLVLAGHERYITYSNSAHDLTEETVRESKAALERLISTLQAQP